jgi:hypothetical protein
MRRSYAISPHPGRFCSSSGAAIESLRHFFILKVRSANLDFTQLANNAALTLNAGAPQDLPSSTFSIDSAAQRFTAGSENRPVIAAVNRCATQNQVRYRIVLEAAKPYLTMLASGTPRRGKPRLYTSFSALSACLKACPDTNHTRALDCQPSTASSSMRFEQFEFSGIIRRYQLCKILRLDCFEVSWAENSLPS